VFKVDSVDIHRLQNAVNGLIARHESLRTHFENKDGNIIQVINDIAECKVEILSSDDITAFIRPFDLAKAPLLRVGVYENTIMIDMHHIITDGGSMPVFLNELNELYMGRSIETAPVQYKQFAVENHDHTESEKYWLSVYSDEVPVLEINTDYHRGQKQSFNGSAIYDSVDIELHNKILAFCKAQNITPYVFYMSGFNILLSKFSGNEDIVVGMPISGRDAKYLDTIGMFVNTIALRNKPIGSKTVTGFLQEVKENSVNAINHQDYPYGELVKKLDIHTPDRNPLFDVMFAYQSEQMTDVVFDDKKAELLPVPITTSKYDLTFNVMPRETDVVIMAEYCTDLYKEHTMQRFIDGYKLILEQLMNSNNLLKDISAITDSENVKLLYAFNDTTVDYPRDRCVHQLFEEQVKKTPDRTAVIADDITLTYTELNEQANRIAHSLVEKGVGVGDIVAFALSRKSYLIATMLGILKAGAAYLPVDPDYPQDRIDYMLSDSNAKLFITEDNIQNLISNGDASNPCVDISSNDLCYCIYTSGSTGQPKGAVICHRNLVNFCDNNVVNNLQHYIAQNCNTVLACGSITFDISNCEIVLSLLLNKTVVFASERELTNINLLADLILQNQIDCVHCTPTKLHTYLDNKGFADAFKNVKCVMVAGEQLTEEVCDRIRKYCSASIFNGYGPTETTMGVGFGEVNEYGITIGKPIANTHIYIVDQYMQPTPIGATGELCIVGDGVGAGYLNRPELTAEKFIDNPFGEGKLYKTGDLAYWREDGNIAYVGRNDFQVKIRGLRIELGEIENAICSIDGISQAVVVVRKNNEGRQLICAFYTGVEADAKEIRSHIGKKLPKYMLPHICTRLDEMPLTSSGKINRKALPEVDLYATQTDVEYVAPVTEQEKILVTAIEATLGIDKIGIMDNFFDVGGDSLKAIELISKLEKQGYHTDTKTIFECDTVKDLAEKLTDTEIEQEVFDYSGDIPATDAQMRVYTAQSMNSDSTTYNVPYVFKVDSVDIHRLQNAVNGLIARHESLRTHFENKDGNIIQVINYIAECKVEILSSDDITAFIRPFDLAKAPLLRVGVYENTIMIDMHHIITDGGSMPVFLKELNELYMGRSIGNTPVQYKQFAVQKQDHTESEKYWLSVYSDEVPVLEINTDYHRGQKQSFNGSAIYDAIDIKLHNKILAFCKAQNITPYVFYMSGFNILLSKFSGNEDIVVGMPISGRGAKYLDTIGMFVNTIALRNKPVGTKTVAEFLQEVKENSVNAINHQDYPYGELVKKLDIHTSDHNPLFDVMFAYQSEQMTDVVFGDKKADLLLVPITTSKYDFTFNVMPRENDVVIMAEYCTDLYKERTIQRFIDGYKLILEQLLNAESIQDISAITKAENKKLLFDFNDTTVDYPRDKCVHQLFEEQVSKTPNNIALKFGDNAFTFAELNGLANGLATELQNNGVGNGDVVAIISKRSYHIVVAMLAIFKCGAAYLPIDYNYPTDRINTIANDAGCKVILTYNVDYTADNTVKIPEDITPVVGNVLCRVNSKDICGIIYTSGSTGTPKGSLLHHKGLVNFSFANDALYKGGTCVISFSTYTFDAFFLDTIAALMRGNVVVLATENQQFSQYDFENLIINNPGCNFFTTPTKFKGFLNNRLNKNFFNNIHSLCVGGEVFPNEFVELVSENTCVYNIYGPTECSMWMLECPVLNEDVTLGKPMKNVQVYIVDKYLKMTPIGVTGELCIAGDGVGAGYLNRPELTTEKFIDNPFGEGKLYKTGDLAYWREDGNIVYVGRNDFQVKIRGLRIELEEIESAICGIDGISQVVVVVRKNTGGRQLICAFYTGAEVDAKDIRSHIGKKLPKYMLPHICTHLDEMPLTSSGKINRKALPEVGLENIVNDTEYVMPETQMQKELCKLIELVLGTTPVGITDDFFDLGGDSLKAIEFVSKAHNEGIYFNLQNVFDYPTVKELCECIENGDKQVISFADVDFTEVNTVLEKNKVEYITTPQKTDVGNILLAGATGYLGIHILADFLDNDNGIAYCLVRGKDKADSTKRLSDLLRFYFGDKYADMNRIEVVCADLQKDKFGLTDTKYVELLNKVDTVINCAASVKHYGSYKYFYEANVETTKRLIEFCKETDAKLIHTSTLSVSGNTFGDAFDGYISETEKHFYESSLYIEQPLENVYGRSKFEAEKAVLDAMCDGLQANIMRMGNLTNRLSDGHFQKNHESNAFLQRVKGILELGLFPEYLIKDTNYSEFTPIDEAANAVMTIARHFSIEQTVFHINSIKVVYFDKLVEIINQLGYDLKLVNGTMFTEVLRQTAKQTGMEHIFETFINDMDENDQLNYDSNIRIENDFTVQYLKQLGFEWSDIGIDYLRKYIEYFKKIGYLR